MDLFADCSIDYGESDRGRTTVCVCITAKFAEHSVFKFRIFVHHPRKKMQFKEVLEAIWTSVRYTAVWLQVDL